MSEQPFPVKDDVTAEAAWLTHGDLHEQRQCATDVLIDINKPVYKTDPVLNEILAFDALSADPLRLPLVRRLARWIRGEADGAAAGL